MDVQSDHLLTGKNISVPEGRYCFGEYGRAISSQEDCGQSPESSE
jgi:hypothetical protein